MSSDSVIIQEVNVGHPLDNWSNILCSAIDYLCWVGVGDLHRLPNQSLQRYADYGKGPDRNCASPIKWCKWPVWICWIYFRHPMGSLEVLWCQFFMDQSHNFFATQLLICWIFSLILHTKANPMTEPIRIYLYLN